MAKIKLLDPKLINMIAAGEVVERPASVVKELAENSIDAGATKITIHIKNGGLNEIKVIDNGSGISPEDVPQAFVQHATSKISTVDDLDSIYTLGFRGEALASISSVADVNLETKMEQSEATVIFSQDGNLQNTASAKSTAGTTITVKDLFAKVPARRKFLRSDQTEFGHIEDTFINIALVNLSVHFELYHNDRLIHRLPAVKSFTERILEIWGEKVAQNLYHSESEIPGGKLITYLGKPDIGRKDRKLQYLFVNSRYISDRALQRAVADGYIGFLPKEIYPVYFVMLELDPKQVDVNVHPRKLEVRIENSQQIFSIIRNTVADALNKQTKEEIVTRVSGARPVSGEFVQNQQSVDEPAFINSTPRLSDARPRTSYTPNPTINSKPGINQSLSFTKNLLQNSRPNEAQESSPSLLGSQGIYNQNKFIGNTNYPTPFQVFATYIVYQQEDQIIYVDQHAAAEKILYEKLRKQLDHTRKRPLLTPLIVDLTAKEKESALAIKDKFATAGLEIEDFGGNSIQVTHLPELTPNLDVEKFIQGVLEHRSELPEEDKALLTRDLSEEAHLLIATLACHGAIRAGQKLTVGEMQNLIADLKECEMPYNCPHGRPVSWAMSKYELEKNFKRVI